jgi:hypothetical protein
VKASKVLIRGCHESNILRKRRRSDQPVFISKKQSLLPSRS